MDKRQRRRLRDLLAKLDAGERDRLTKRATKLRQATLRTMSGDARRPEQEDFLLRLLDEQEAAAAGFAAAPGGAAPPAESDGSRRGTVIAVTAGACVVQAGGDLLDAALPADLTRRQQSGLAVGDEVLLEPRGEGHRVTAVLPRRSLLTRADPHDPRRARAIAANIDVVVVMVAAKTLVVCMVDSSSSWVRSYAVMGERPTITIRASRPLPAGSHTACWCPRRDFRQRCLLWPAPEKTGHAISDRASSGITNCPSGCAKRGKSSADAIPK